MFVPKIIKTIAKWFVNSKIQWNIQLFSDLIPSALTMDLLIIKNIENDNGLWKRGLIHIIKPIKVKDVNDIEQINRIVSRYPFDIWIHSKSGMADAKSLLGMYVLQINEPLFLVVPDEAESEPLFRELEAFITFDIPGEY